MTHYLVAGHFENEAIITLAVQANDAAGAFEAAESKLRHVWGDEMANVPFYLDAVDTVDDVLRSPISYYGDPANVDNLRIVTFHDTGDTVFIKSVSVLGDEDAAYTRMEEYFSDLRRQTDDEYYIDNMTRWRDMQPNQSATATA